MELPLSFSMNRPTIVEATRSDFSLDRLLRGSEKTGTVFSVVDSRINITREPGNSFFRCKCYSTGHWDAVKLKREVPLRLLRLVKKDDLFEE